MLNGLIQRNTKTKKKVWYLLLWKCQGHWEVLIKYLLQSNFIRRWRATTSNTYLKVKESTLNSRDFPALSKEPLCSGDPFLAVKAPITKQWILLRGWFLQGKLSHLRYILMQCPHQFTGSWTFSRHITGTYSISPHSVKHVAKVRAQDSCQTDLMGWQDLTRVRRFPRIQVMSQRNGHQN